MKVDFLQISMRSKGGLVVMKWTTSADCIRKVEIPACLQM